MRCTTSAMLLLLLVACSGGALGDVITVDGNDSDWLNPWSSHNDPMDVYTTPGPGGVAQWIPGHDLEWTRYIWDSANYRSAFLGTTYGLMEHTNLSYAGDFVEILINADDDSGTGAPMYHEMAGADYRIYWNLDGDLNTAYNPTSASNPVTFWEWSDTYSNWMLVDGIDADQILIAKGDMIDYTVIELTVDPMLFGAPNCFTWGMYLDQGSTASDDASPNNMNQRGYTPEPTTMVLLPLGIAGLAAWSRGRRNQPA